MRPLRKASLFSGVSPVNQQPISIHHPVSVIEQMPPSSLTQHHNVGQQRVVMKSSLSSASKPAHPAVQRPGSKISPGVVTGRHSSQVGPVSSTVSQLPRPIPSPVRPRASQEESHRHQPVPSTVADSFQSNQSSTASHCRLLGNPPNSVLFVKGTSQQIQLKPAPHRVSSRNAGSGAPQQQTAVSQHQGQLLPLGLGQLSESCQSRAHLTVSQSTATQPVIDSLTQGCQQHPGTNGDAGPLRTQHSVVGKNASGFSVVRPSVFGAVPTSLSEVPHRDRVADSRVIINISDRKVRLTSELDTSSLYALCRRWVWNDAPRKDQPALWDCTPLPRPLPIPDAQGVGGGPLDKWNKCGNAKGFQEESLVEPFTEQDLLEHHIKHFKNVRKRFREDRMHRIARFKPRLALLLPCNHESGKHD